MAIIEQYKDFTQLWSVTVTAGYCAGKGHILPTAAGDEPKHYGKRNKEWSDHCNKSIKFEPAI